MEVASASEAVHSAEAEGVSKKKMKTLTHDNEDDFFDEIEIGEIFLIAGMLFSEARELAEDHDLTISNLGNDKAKVTDKDEYKPHRSSSSDFSSFSAINSISHSSGGFGGLSHSGGFGGFGGGSFGGGGGGF